MWHRYTATRLDSMRSIKIYPFDYRSSRLHPPTGVHVPNTIVAGSPLDVSAIHDNKIMEAIAAVLFAQHSTLVLGGMMPVMTGATLRGAQLVTIIAGDKVLPLKWGALVATDAAPIIASLAHHNNVALIIPITDANWVVDVKDDDVTSSSLDADKLTRAPSDDESDGSGGKSDGLGGESDGSDGESDGSGGKSDGLGGESDGSDGESDGSGGKSDGLGGESDGSGGESDGSGGKSDCPGRKSDHLNGESDGSSGKSDGPGGGSPSDSPEELPLVKPAIRFGYHVDITNRLLSSIDDGERQHLSSASGFDADDELTFRRGLETEDAGRDLGFRERLAMACLLLDLPVDEVDALLFHPIPTDDHVNPDQCHSPIILARVLCKDGLASYIGNNTVRPQANCCFRGLFQQLSAYIRLIGTTLASPPIELGTLNDYLQLTEQVADITLILVFLTRSFPVVTRLPTKSQSLLHGLVYALYIGGLPKRNKSLTKSVQWLIEAQASGTWAAKGGPGPLLDLGDVQ